MVKKKKLTRRKTLLLGLGTLAGSIAVFIVGKLRSKYSRVSEKGEERDEFDKNLALTPLKDRAAAKGLIYGAFVQGSYQTFSKDRQFQSNFLQECELLVASFYWNWGGVRPNESTYDFTATDYFAKFATENSMLLRGHPLIWYRTTPNWLLDKFNAPNTTSQEIEKILIDHITTVVGRYAGKIHSWDVVNEAINVKDGRVDGFRDTKISGDNNKKFPSWLDFLGRDYIDLAFQVASKADPQAMLTYNEYGIDYDIPEQEAKRTAVLKLLESLKAKGTPIQALGIQAHLNASMNQRFNSVKFRQFLSDVASFGLKIMITEMDVADKWLPSTMDMKTRDRAVAQAYQDYLAVALDEPAVVAVATWGLSDRYTWLKNKPHQDGTLQRPLPLDAQLNRKLAWQAIANAFDNAPRR